MSGYRGVIPILQTPFFENGELDLESMERQVRFACDTGAHGVAFPGFVSEWWKLTGEEIFACAGMIANTARGRTKVILNVTAQSTPVAVREAERFVSLGCDGLMCLPPFIVPPSPEGLISHMDAILSSCPLPHVLQYSASLTGTRFSMDQLRSLRSRHSHFVSIKVDFIPPGPVVGGLKKALQGEDLTYLVGFAGLQLPGCLARGANGLMGGMGHLPEDLSVFESLQRDPDGAGLEDFRRLLPLLNFEMQTVEQSIATHKFLLRERGIIRTDHIRAPAQELDAASKSELSRHFAHVRRAVT